MVSSYRPPKFDKFPKGTAERSFQDAQEAINAFALEVAKASRTHVWVYRFIEDPWCMKVHRFIDKYLARPLEVAFRVMFLVVVFLLCYILIFAVKLDSAETRIYTDPEIIEAVDETTMLGRMARGNWDYRGDGSTLLGN